MDNSKELLRLLVNRSEAFSKLYEKFSLTEIQWICQDITYLLTNIRANAEMENLVREEILRAQRVIPLKKENIR